MVRKELLLLYTLASQAECRECQGSSAGTCAAAPAEVVTAPSLLQHKRSYPRLSRKYDKEVKSLKANISNITFDETTAAPYSKYDAEANSSAPAANASAAVSTTSAAASTTGAPVATTAADNSTVSTDGNVTVETTVTNGSSTDTPVMVPDKDLITIDVTVKTSDKDAKAGTNSGASMSLFIDEAWTPEVELCKKVGEGESVVKSVKVARWPAKIRLTALGNDAWMLESITLTALLNDANQTVVTVPVLQTTEASDTDYHADSKYWLDGDELAPSQITYSVESVPVAESACLTAAEQTFSAMGYSTSEPGTPCVFGADPRDEGSHCIMDDGIYGSFGWCYTSEDRRSWGSCGEGCPLYGPQKVLSDKLDRILAKLEEKQVQESSNITAVVAAAAASATQAAKMAADKVTAAQKALAEAEAMQASAQTEADGLSGILTSR